MHETDAQSNVMSPLYGTLVCMLVFGKKLHRQKEGKQGPKRHDL